jgi:hypothetical protein
MSETAVRRKRRWWLYAAALLLATASFSLFRLWERDADIANWMKEATSRSLYVSRHDEPILPVLRSTPIIGKLFRRSGIVVIAYQGADLTALAQMRPCPARLILGNTGPMTASELKRLESQFSAAVESQQSSR